MEELQLLVEAKLYDQPVEKLKEVCQHFKITVEAGLSKSRLLRKIRMEIEKKVDEDGDDLEQFLLEMGDFCGETQQQFHEEIESGPEYYEMIIQARKEVEEMKTKFAELMELQEKKWQEAEKKYNETLKGKRVSA